MPVPKRKRSRARRDKRFANKNIKETSIVACKQCKEPLMPHQACLSCGFYKGVKVLKTKVDRSLQRKEVRAKKGEQSSENTAENTPE